MRSVLNIAARIVALLFRCGPAAIARFVIAVHVREAIYGMSFTRSRSHIRIEGRKVVGPSLANRNAAPAIQAVFIVIRIIASVFHVKPDVVFVRTSCPFRLPIQRPMLAYLGSVELNFVATAGDRSTTRKLSGRYGALLSAVTSAMPEIAKAFLGFASLMGKRENGPSSEPLAFKAKTVFRFAGHKEPPQQVADWAVRGLDSFGGSARILT